jgi:hypothetical protein
LINDPNNGYDCAPQNCLERIHEPIHADARKKMNYPKKEVAPFSQERKLSRNGYNM